MKRVDQVHTERTCPDCGRSDFKSFNGYMLHRRSCIDRWRREQASRVVDSTKPYKVRASCGHIDVRPMRESTAGVPYSEAVVLDAPNGAPCRECQKGGAA